MDGRRAFNDDGARYTFTCDASGNPLTQRNAAQPFNVTMTWDAENRLATYHQSGVSQGNAFDQQLIHIYNGDGQRVERQGFPFDARFVWDGQNIHLKLNLSNVLLDNFQYEFCSDGFGNLICNSTPYFNLYNFLGSTTGLSLAGALAAQFSYSSWGELAVGSPSSPDMPYLFVGRTGYYCDDEGRISTATSPFLPLSVRGRFYRTDWARWINQDPLRFDAAWLNTMLSSGILGGMADLYLYVANNPINATDPSGLRFVGGRENSCVECLQPFNKCEIENLKLYSACLAKIADLGTVTVELVSCAALCKWAYAGSPAAVGACIVGCSACWLVIDVFLTRPICDEAYQRGTMKCGNAYNRCAFKGKGANCGPGHENWRPD